MVLLQRMKTGINMAPKVAMRAAAQFSSSSKLQGRAFQRIPLFQNTLFHSSSLLQFPSTTVGSSPSALNVQLIVRNGSSTQGRLVLNLPLPGLQGLSSVKLHDETLTVQDVINAIKQKDPSLKTVEMTNKNGIKLARTVFLRELTGMEFILRLNHVNILIENDQAKDDSREHGESLAFATIKAAIEKDSRIVLPLDEYYRICINAGAEEAVANKWLRELQRRNLVVHFDRSKNDELKNAIILRPNSSESVLTLQNALDSELYNIKHEKRVKESRQKELQSELKKLLVADAELRKTAKKSPNTLKWVTLTAFGGFYGSMVYAVWDVFSWDVMEPITYFIGFTAVLGNSFYHSITKKEASYTNIWHKRYEKRVQELYEERKLNPQKIEDVKKKLDELERDIELLVQLEGRSALQSSD